MAFRQLAFAALFFALILGCKQEKSPEATSTVASANAATASTVTAAPAASATAASASAAGSATPGSCTAPDVLLRTHEFDNPQKCVRLCVNGKNGTPCPAKFSCAGTGTTEAGEKKSWCMADLEPPPKVECKAPEVMVYESDRDVAFCGKPCKDDKGCGAGKHCAEARKNWEATMGMRAAEANVTHACK